MKHFDVLNWPRSGKQRFKIFETDSSKRHFSILSNLLWPRKSMVFWRSIKQFRLVFKKINFRRVIFIYNISCVFRSRKKFSTTYAIVLFFFFSRPFHENFKFLKNCPYDFYKILHSHSTPKGAPACAMASKSYDWVVRNIAKISPKMAEKQPFFDFFRFSQKLSIRFERNFLQLFYTILESYMCNGIKIVWLGCEKHSQN